MIKYKLLLICILYFLSWHIASAQVTAFPGAEGFGAKTVGGRGGKILKVTNMNDSGPGSLRAALEAEGPRFVVFTTGGIINLEEPLIIRNPFVTVAGQTASGDGICIRGNGVKIKAHDVVLRYLRIRPGDIDFGPENDWADLDALTIGSAANKDSVFNIVIDHCSLSWGVDEVIGMWHKAHDITVQNCIIAEALNNSQHPKGEHGMGILIGGGTTKVSMHHNLIAHNEQRNPRLGSDKLEFDFRNNVIYNPGGTVTDIGDSYRKISYQHINYIGNYIIKGNNTAYLREVMVRRFSGNADKLQLHIENNIGFYPNREDWQMVQDMEGFIIKASQRAREPFPFPPVTTFSPQQALDHVLSEAGAILPARDPVDRKTVKDVKMNKGKTIDARRHILQWPPFESGLPLLDSDSDGMPDHWEEGYNLNPYSTPEDRDDNLDSDGDGYTNIEEYLNNTSPKSQGKVAPLSSATTFSFNEPEKPEVLLPFELAQNYPNPFSNSTHFKFTIPEAGHVNLQVVDHEGAKVNDIINTFLYEGKYEIIWDTSHLRPGMYLVILSTGNHSKSIKSILRRE